MKRIILVSIFIPLAIPMLAVAAESKGVLYFSAPQSAAVGQNITAVVMADPKGQMLDTVKAVVTFSKGILEVKSVTLGPVFSVADPDSFYNNSEGLVSYAGGIPGGTTQLSPFITIVFAVKKPGNATVAFDGQSIMLSGGVNMLSGTGKSLAFTIAEPAVAPGSETQNASQPIANQNNASPKPAGKAAAKPAIITGSSADLAAALEVPVVPAARQASFESLNYLIANRWFFLFWLLVAVDTAFILRKKIPVLLLRYSRTIAKLNIIGLGSKKHALRKIK